MIFLALPGGFFSTLALEANKSIFLLSLYISLETTPHPPHPPQFMAIHADTMQIPAFPQGTGQ